MASASLMLPPAPRRPSVGRAAKKATPRSSSPHVAVGARVEAAWHGQYYGAQVTALDGPKSVHVLFDDGMESTVAVSEVRPRGSSKEPASSCVPPTRTGRPARSERPLPRRRCLDC